METARTNNIPFHFRIVPATRIFTKFKKMKKIRKENNGKHNSLNGFSVVFSFI